MALIMKMSRTLNYCHQNNFFFAMFIVEQKYLMKKNNFSNILLTNLKLRDIYISYDYFNHVW